MRIFVSVIGVLALLVLGIGGFVYQSAHSFEVETLSDDLYVLYGMGGNVAVLRTGDGAIVIDTMTLVSQGDRILERAEELAGEKVAVLINSHYHVDHTHGNPAFAPGIRVVSTSETLHHLKETDADYFADSPALLPNELIDGQGRISLGEKNITLLHPGRGHTNGDLVVLFEEESVVHMGDLYFNKHYPNIDLEAGGSVQEWSATIDNVFANLNFDRVIPGHGPVTGPEGLRQYQRFIAQLAGIGSAAVKQGASLEDTIESDALTEDEGYTEIKMIVPIGIDRTFVLHRAWEEASGEFVLRE